MRPLGKTQRKVLLALARHEVPPTASEIAWWLNQRSDRSYRPTADPENVSKTLWSLERRGLVERQGVAYRGRCWSLTEGGRQAVEQIHEDDR